MIDPKLSEKADQIRSLLHFLNKEGYLLEVRSQTQSPPDRTIYQVISIDKKISL